MSCVLTVYELTLPYRAVVILIVRGREMLTVVVVLGASRIISVSGNRLSLPQIRVSKGLMRFKGSPLVNDSTKTLVNDSTKTLILIPKPSNTS